MIVTLNESNHGTSTQLLTQKEVYQTLDNCQNNYSWLDFFFQYILRNNYSYLENFKLIWRTSILNEKFEDNFEKQL